MAGHLSRLVHKEDTLPLKDNFPDEQLLAVQKVETLWFADIAYYVVTKVFPSHLSKNQRDKFRSEAKHYIWEDPCLFKICPDQVIQRYIPDTEFNPILTLCHSEACGGHFSSNRTARRVLD